MLGIKVVFGTLKGMYETKNKRVEWKMTTFGIMYLRRVFKNIDMLKRIIVNNRKRIVVRIYMVKI